MARGRHFFSKVRQVAKALRVGFDWRLEIVPGVGHDYEQMSEAAAQYRYGGTR